MTIKQSPLMHREALIVGQVTWAVAVTFIRASMLALYTRIFRTRDFRMTCYVVHGINAAFGLATILGACLICLPISFYWDHSTPGGYCGNQKSLDLFIGVFNLLMDVTVVVLPMPVLWGLQTAVGKKVVLSGMFGLGIMYAYRIPPSFICSQYLRTLVLTKMVVSASSLLSVYESRRGITVPTPNRYIPSSPCSHVSKHCWASSTRAFPSSSPSSRNSVTPLPRPGSRPSCQGSFPSSCAEAKWDRDGRLPRRRKRTQERGKNCRRCLDGMGLMV